MSDDPKRWLDPSSDAPDGARELLQQARPSAAIDKATLAASAVAVTKLAATPAAAAAALPIAAKLAVSVCVAATVTAVAVRTFAPGAHAKPRSHSVARAPNAREASSRTASATPAAPLQQQPAPVAAEVPAPAEPVAPQSIAVEPRPRSARARAADRAIATPASPAPAAALEPPMPDALALEVAGLDRARALLASDPAAALSLIVQLGANAPNAVLAEERELIAIDALHRLHRDAAARARADALLARHPGTLYARRIAAMLR